MRLVIKYLCITGFFVGFLSSCNEPPLYGKNAREFLKEQGESVQLIDSFSKRRPIGIKDATRLSNYQNQAVLHLLAANTSTPIAIVEKLASHSNMEVRTGVAINPSVPLTILLGLRSPGKYTTENAALARNPALPQELIWQMYRGGEASLLSFAMNPNCPVELMRTILDQGNELDRTWLANNPNIPQDVMQALERESSKVIKNYLNSNPAYQQWKASQ